MLDVVDQLSDIDWLTSDDSLDNDDDDDDDDMPAAAAAGDDVLSIDVQDSPVVSGGTVPVIKTLPLTRPSQVVI